MGRDLREEKTKYASRQGKNYRKLIEKKKREVKKNFPRRKKIQRDSKLAERSMMIKQ